jgi:hypothetical protein
MVTVALFLFLLGILLGYVSVQRDSPGLLIFSGILGFVGFFGFLATINLQMGQSTLTGYIYSAETKFGYTTAHIRFSQNAGTDAQPEFCVKSDSEAGQAIQQYTGTDTKVRITIPPYFYFANNPFACGTTSTKIQVTK